MREEGEEEQVTKELIHVERINYFRRLEEKERREQERKRQKRKKFDLFKDYGDSD